MCEIDGSVILLRGAKPSSICLGLGAWDSMMVRYDS